MVTVSFAISSLICILTCDNSCGYKGIVGTIEEAQTIEYLEKALQEIQKETRGLTGAPKFETWVQRASGTHRFDIMDNSKRLLFAELRYQCC